MAPKRKRVDDTARPPLLYEQPLPPHHAFKQQPDESFKCIRCAFVLGTGGGHMPKCGDKKRAKSKTIEKKKIGWDELFA